jgi:alkylation response protein AidB-like acyl-CoA dehydrogenase
MMKNGNQILGGMFLLEPASIQEVFTPEEFSAEHRDVQRAVDDFIDGEIISRGEEIETLNYDLSKMLMLKAGELGILGIDISEKYGGMELDKICSAIVSERFGYGAGSFTITEINHTGIGTLPVALFGTENQKQKYLPRLISGEYIGAFGLTEPESGSDALNPLTSAILSENGKYYILNGAKQFITNAGFADLIFVYAKVNDQHFTAFIVEQNWEGISTDDEEEKMGMHGTSTRAYHFDNVKVPLENVLGEVGKGHLVALNALNMGRFKVGSICVGSSKRAFDEAIKYAKKRYQFGKAICEFGLIKEKIARMAVRIYAAESIMYRTAGLIQAKLNNDTINEKDIEEKTAKTLEEYLIECSINKIYGSETEDLVVDEEVQIYGGYGYIRGNHPELAYRNARINRIWEGTNEINRLIIANTFIRKAVELSDFDSICMSAYREMDKCDFSEEQSHALNYELKLIKIGKNAILIAINSLISKYGTDLREEQEILGIISNILINFYAFQSTILRTLKILNNNKQDKGKYKLNVNITKLICHNCFKDIIYLIHDILNMTNDRQVIFKYNLDNLTFYDTNKVILKKRIANKFIQYGRYIV